MDFEVEAPLKDHHILSRNMLFRSQQPKIRRQYADIVNCLKLNPGNYFVNTAGFVKLMKILNDAS